MMPADDRTRGWALVTGACSGIGLEIARELARRGHPLVLVSENEARLHNAARSLAAEHRVAVQSIVTDLTAPDAAACLHREVAERGLAVDVLVSNAGMFFYGDVADTDPLQIERMMHLHVLTPAQLCRHFGRDMRDRRHGHVMLVSSISAWRDFPDIACYGASKRFLRSFAASLAEELAPWGVHVTCLAPGATATGLYAHTSIPVDMAVKYGVMKDPAGVARAGVRGMFGGKRMVIPGVGARAMAGAMLLLPRCLIRGVHGRTHAGDPGER